MRNMQKDRIKDIFRLNGKAGEVGIEIEMEGKNLLNTENMEEWFCTEDHSLRGESMEYVLREPIYREHVPNALNSLYKALIDHGATLIPSDRCGVHIHINCQKMQYGQVLRFIALYLVLEELMVKYCGADREGNLFCLRASDAEVLVSDLVNCQLKQRNIGPYLNNQIRYSSMNLAALKKYGSIEFRSLKTPENLADINTWVEMLLAIKDASLKYVAIEDIIEGVSRNGAAQFLEGVMGKYAELLYCSDLDGIIMRGARRIQDLAYVNLIKNAEDFAQQHGAIKYYQDAYNTYMNGKQQKAVNPEPPRPQRPLVKREVYLHKHGEGHAANVLYEDDEEVEKLYWDALKEKWVAGKPAPLSDLEAIDVLNRQIEIKAAWVQYDQKMDQFNKALAAVKAQAARWKVPVWAPMDYRQHVLNVEDIIAQVPGRGNN